MSRHQGITAIAAITPLIRTVRRRLVAVGKLLAGHCVDRSEELFVPPSRFVIARVPGECFLERGSSESGETCPGAIPLGPRIIAVDSRYLPLKTGLRFSKKALRASWASSLLKAMRILDSS